MIASSTMLARRQRGFTLIEAVVVIVITAIVGGIVALFIRMPVQGYIDTVGRAELADLADTTLRRMKRDIRLALPNSLRVATVAAVPANPARDVQFLEFLLTKTGGRYLADEDEVVGGDILSWTDAADTQFRIVGTMPTDKQAILPGDFLVVYNLGDTQEPGNAYNCDVPCNRASIGAVDAATNTITLNANPFPGQVPPLPSPGRRFQIVTSAVSYVCDPVQRTLTRYWNYAIRAVQPTDVAQLTAGGGRSALLASGVSSCEFDYQNLANIHSGLIGLRLGLGVADGNIGVLTLMQQIHVDNTP